MSDEESWGGLGDTWDEAMKLALWLATARHERMSVFGIRTENGWTYRVGPA